MILIHVYTPIALHRVAMPKVHGCSLLRWVFTWQAFLNDKEVTQKAGKERINDFLRNHACYDLLKHSGKVRTHVKLLALLGTLGPVYWHSRNAALYDIHRSKQTCVRNPQGL